MTASILLTTGCGLTVAARDLTATPIETGGVQITTVSSSTDGVSRSPGFSVQLALPTATVTATASPIPTVPTRAPPSATATPVPDLAPAATPSPYPPAASQPAASPTATPTPLPPTGDPVLALQLINDYRSRSGLSALRSNPNLVLEATSYAALMARRNFFGHDGIDGSTPSSRAAASGYAGRFKGEAIAAGQSTAQSVVATWLNSPAHAAILLDPAAVEVGIGYFYATGNTYNHYWVFVVGVP